MSGIKYLSQIDMRVSASEANHLVRLGDLMDILDGHTTSPVRVVMTDAFVGAYNSGDKTLTQTTPAELVIDGVTVDLSDRVLVQNQADLTQNGIYEVTTLGVDGVTEAVLTRASDFNTNAAIMNGLFVPVSDGDAGAGTRWQLTVGAFPWILDSTNLVFSKYTTDITKVVEMTLPLVGDDATTIYSINHSLGTLNVTHELRDDTTGETVYAMFKRISVNDIEVKVGAPLGVGNDLTLILRAQVEPK